MRRHGVYFFQKKIDVGISQPILGCATLTSSTECCEGTMNAYLTSSIRQKGLAKTSLVSIHQTEEMKNMFGLGVT